MWHWLWTVLHEYGPKASAGPRLPVVAWVGVRLR
jgi:hypothetical protein